MALTHNGTIVNIKASELPSDYTKPTVTDFDDYESQYTAREFTIAKSTVENADAATTVGNIVSQLNTDIQALINADYDTTGLTVTSFARLNILSHNFSLNGVKYTNGTINYVCTVDIFIKTA